MNISWLLILLLALAAYALITLIISIIREYELEETQSATSKGAIQYDEDKLYRLLKKAEYISVNEEGFVNEQVNDGVYKLYSDEAAFIKNVIGFDNSGYEGVIEVVNQRILDAQDCGEEILNKVFAVRIIDIPDSEDKREEM